MAIDLKTLKKTTAILAPRIVIYGPPGVGKTTFGVDAPDPLFLDVEGGLGGFTGVTKYPESEKERLNNWDEAMEFLAAIYQQEVPFKSIVIDSITWLQKLAFDKVCEEGKKKSIEDFGYGKGYVLAAEKMREFLTGLDAIRNVKNIPIIVIAHMETKRFDNPMGESYDRHSIQLHKQIFATVEQWCDCLLLAKKKIVTRHEDSGFGNKKSKAIGDGSRVLYTDETAGFVAKNRYRLPPEIPFTWADFMANLNNSLNPNTGE